MGSIVVFGIWGILFVCNRISDENKYLANPFIIKADIPSFSTELPDWNESSVCERISQIDWYQFEKFCSALLVAEGFIVERKGGAGPDGGVDLVATRGNTTTLVQCKHWVTWQVKLPVVRQLLGSMTDFNVDRGVIFTVNGWTSRAAEFAQKHRIGLVDGYDLATRAIKVLDVSTLDTTLCTDVHHCPKCEAPMVWKNGNFKSFWGCSRFPRCRGTLRNIGAP